MSFATSNSQRFLLVLTIILMSVLFFIGGPDYRSPRSYKSLWNLGHILYFAILPLLLLPVLSNKKIKPTNQISMIVGITFVLGYLVEALQSGFNRTPDTGDLLRNFIGVGIAICFLLPIRHTIPKMAITLFQIILLIALTLQFYPIAIALIDEHHARQTFPVLSDFQTAGQIHRWTSDNHIAIENDIGRQGNHAMRADLTTNRYSGFSLKHFPANWQHYHKFEFSIYNPSEKAIEITCRIHDKLHLQGLQPYEDRFNATHSFTTGWTTITISLEEIRQAPADRQMDLGQIYSIIFFASDLPHPRTIYIDDVRLY